jgi:hypothetical protein
MYYHRYSSVYIEIELAEAGGTEFGKNNVTQQTTKQDRNNPANG